MNAHTGGGSRLAAQAVKEVASLVWVIVTDLYKVSMSARLVDTLPNSLCGLACVESMCLGFHGLTMP